MVRNHNILLVDRDDLTRQSLARRLRQRGCHMLEADGLSETQVMETRRALDVAIVDLDSLEEEGLAVVRALRKRRPGCRIIVLVSARETSLSIQAMRLGAFDDQTHPVDVELLLSRIRRALASRHRGGESSTIPNVDEPSLRDAGGDQRPGQA
jgi:DNA-binding NtrC family response regulator